MADGVAVLVGDGDAERAGGVACAGSGEVADEGGVEGAEAVRLAGPLGQAQQGEQREREVAERGHGGAVGGGGHGGAAWLAAGRAGAGAAAVAAAGAAAPGLRPLPGPFPVGPRAAFPVRPADHSASQSSAPAGSVRFALTGSPVPPPAPWHSGQGR